MLSSSPAPTALALREPVVVFGITARSGTNYLLSALARHPDLRSVAGREHAEDYLVRHGELLWLYADTVAACWAQYWNEARVDRGDPRAWRARLLASMGRALLEVLAEGELETRIITKTPSVENLEMVFDLFPGARVVLLVRDGRSVTESSVASYGVSHERAMQNWARAARRVVRFVEVAPSSQVLLVRYEDVVERPRVSLDEILAFAGTDPGRYPADALDDVPVLGSSENYAKTPGSGWGVAVRPHDFAPLRRWAGWSDATLERFNWVAGDEMRALGYELAGPAPSRRAVHAVKSAPWQARYVLKDKVLPAAARGLQSVRAYGSLAALARRRVGLVP